ncbi:MAG: DUF362 domain-containing protein, partial [Promethearchaeota archaeon]
MDRSADRSEVLIIQKNSVESEKDATLRALNQFNGKKYFTGTEKVLIHPNWIIAEHYSRGNTTSTETLEGIVCYLLQECRLTPDNIIIGEGGYPSETDKCIKINGVRRLEREYGIKVININNDSRITKIPDDPLALKSVKIAHTAEE